MLFIVPTPIGNLEDITLRAIRVLKEVDLIAAEDTRHSRILLNKYEIKTGTDSFHSYSSKEKLEKFISLLKQGKNIALITDAGMPGISDPGFLLIKRVVEENIPLTVLPGPSAFITALVASGFPADKFVYLGYLPLKHKRKKILESLKNENRTIVFYEAPHRLLRTLPELHEILGDGFQIAVCRELTKKFEEIFRGKIEDAIAHYKHQHPRGEFTLVLRRINPLRQN